MDSMVVITGAGTGIGQALAIKLANNGYEVLGIGRRLELLQKTQEHNPTKIHVLQADISQVSDREKIVEQVAKINKKICIVHNAAMAEPITLLKNLSLEDWRQHQAVNIEAPLFLTQILLPYLKNGRVLHISSGLAHYAMAGVGAYCISKAALHMLYLCYSEELKEFNIAVGSARPGVVDTPMQGVLRNQDKTELPQVENFIHFKESNALILPEDVADFLSWLLFKTRNEEFSAKEWDIADKSHHAQWLKNKNIE